MDEDTPKVVIVGFVSCVALVIGFTEYISMGAKAIGFFDFPVGDCSPVPSPM